MREWRERKRDTKGAYIGVMIRIGMLGKREKKRIRGNRVKRGENERGAWGHKKHKFLSPIIIYN